MPSYKSLDLDHVIILTEEAIRNARSFVVEMQTTYIVEMIAKGFLATKVKTVAVDAALKTSAGIVLCRNLS